VDFTRNETQRNVVVGERWAETLEDPTRDEDRGAAIGWGTSGGNGSG
jgi:hypothetical protein